MSERALTDQLIPQYDLSLITPACFPGAPAWKAELHLPGDISEVLPFLNAELEGAEYDPGAGVLLWQKDYRKYAFRAHQIDIAPVEEREEAQRLAERAVELVNDIWARRREIEPREEGKRPPPSFLAIYRLLPATNCGECGYATCMAFANALSRDPKKQSLCPYLPAGEYAALQS